MDANTFLLRVYGDAANEENQIAIWTLKDKRTAFFPSSTTAAEYAISRKEETDVYFGLGLIRGSRVEAIARRRGRGYAKDVTKITCLWADIDYGKQSRSKKIPPNRFEAMAVVERMGVKPSIVVNSGNGLHVYWLFPEAITKAEAGELPVRWGRTLNACADCLGYQIDTVSDFSRVFRVPGTFNYKEPTRRAVVVDMANAYRYEPSTLETHCIDDAFLNENATTRVSAVSVNDIANPPADKLHAACENSPLFKKTWEHRRNDLADPSPSGYDMSLASQAAQFGWTDQETADLLIAFRIKHKLDVDKVLNRRDYLTRTIGKAKSDENSARNLTRIGEVAAGLPESGVVKKKRSEIIESLSNFLGIKVAEWIKYGSEEGEYHLILTDGQRIHIGPVENVGRFQKFSDRVYDVTGATVNVATKTQWVTVKRLFSAIRDTQDISGSGRVEQLNDWIASYLGSQTVFEAEKNTDWHLALNTGLPVIKDGRLHVNLTHLRNYVYRVIGDPSATSGRIMSCLRSAGYTRMRLRVSVPTPEGETEKKESRYWQSQNGFSQEAARTASATVMSES